MWAVGSTDDTDVLSRWGQLNLTAENSLSREASYVICHLSFVREQGTGKVEF